MEYQMIQLGPGTLKKDEMRSAGGEQRPRRIHHTLRESRAEAQADRFFQSSRRLT